MNKDLVESVYELLFFDFEVGWYEGLKIIKILQISCCSCESLSFYSHSFSTVKFDASMMKFVSFTSQSLLGNPNSVTLATRFAGNSIKRLKNLNSSQSSSGLLFNNNFLRINESM